MRNKTENAKGRKKLFSLRKQISRFLLAFCALIMILWFVWLAVSIRSFQNEQDQNRSAVLEKYAETLDNSIIQLNDVVGTIFSTNSAFIGIDQYRTSVEEAEYTYTLLNLLQIQVKSNRNIEGLFLYYNNMKKNLYYVNENMSFAVREELKKRARAVGEETYIKNVIYSNSMYIQKTSEDTYYNVFFKRTAAALSGSISLGAGLPDSLERKASYGVIYEKQFYPIRGETMELSAAECEALQTGKNWMGDYAVYMCPLGTTDMAVVEIIPNSIRLYVNSLHILLALLGVLFAFLSLTLHRFVSDELTRPLEDMTNALSQIQAGVWEIDFSTPNRIEEIENVRDTVNVMLGEIEQYKISAYEEQLEKQKTQLQYLQLQLAPHFYTNCLKNAYYMLMLKEYENVERFLLCLSTHLRYLLQKDAQMVTVLTERDFVLNYINLQKLMSEKTLICDMMIDEEALLADIPILTLQTFVENSVKYARDAKQMELKIQICVRYRRSEDGDYLDIRVSDNGHGYPEEILRVLNESDVSSEQRFGVGVINLQSRLRLHYGKKASWYFSNESGADSELILPVNGGKRDEGIAGR